MFLDLVFHPLFEVSCSRTQGFYSINNIDHELVTVDLIADR